MKQRVELNVRKRKNFSQMSRKCALARSTATDDEYSRLEHGFKSKYHSIEFPATNASGASRTKLRSVIPSLRWLELVNDVTIGTIKGQVVPSPVSNCANLIAATQQVEQMQP